MRKFYTAILLLVSGVTYAQFDAGIDSLHSSSAYYSRPISQFQNITWTSIVGNQGTGTITGVTSNVTVNPGGFTGASPSTASLTSGNQSNQILSPAYSNASLGVYDANFSVNINEADNDASNDTLSWQFAISDSVYARERGNFVGGIGFTGASGYFGQSFEIFNQDTLTSIDVRLESPTAGDTIRFILYNFVGGLPTTGVDTSDYYVIPSDSADWYTVAFPCDVILPAGDYFVAVEQVNTNNLGFGYSAEYYEPLQLYYSTTGTTWTTFETAGFSVTLGLRLNLGTPGGTLFTYDLGPDTTFCPGVGAVLDATQLTASYLWSNGATTPTINVLSAGTYTVTVSKCGVSTTDMVTLSAAQAPDVNLGNDTSYCENNGLNYTITLSGTPNASYFWTTGDTTNSETFTAPGVYAVAGNLNGCIDTDTIEIIEVPSLNALDLGPDIQYCSYNPINQNLDVTNIQNASYLWNDNSTTPTKTVTGPGTYSVTVSQTGVCNETLSDTLVVTELAPPAIALNDTFFCLGSSVVLNPGQGYDSYAWSNGDTTETLDASTSGNYTVTVTTVEGCEATASALVSIRPSVNIDLGPDVTFWQPVTIDAGTGYTSYLWSTGETTQSIEANTTGTYWVEVSKDGCSGSDTVEVTLNLGLSSLTEGDVTMYPNPTSGTIFLDYPGNTEELTVNIFSMDGKEIFNQRMVVGGNASAQIDMNGNTPGVYIIRLEKDGESVMKRFVLR